MSQKLIGKIHAADLRTSKRLQRAYFFLFDGQWHTTREIQNGADICNPNTAKAELIDNGCEVECAQNGRYFYYRMTKGVSYLGAHQQVAA